MKHTSIIVAVALALIAALPAVSAQAQNLRSFVSGHGSDSNNCTLTTPCRTFQAAFNVTNAGGEIAVLDSAGYGGLTINKAISIVNPGGVEGGIIVPSGGTGIVINAGANDAVSLRGLTIDGGGVGATGIQFNTGLSLIVENCVIHHVANDGINFYPNATSKLSVSNTVASDNGNFGMFVQPTGSGDVTAVFNHVEVKNNGDAGLGVTGFFSTGTVNVTASDSVASGNGEGFTTGSGIGHAPTTLTVFHSVAANNTFGVFVSGTGSTQRIAQSVMTGNLTGWFVNAGGVIASYGDNYIDGNGGTSGSLTPVARQ